jgi:hypothetical protein
MGWHYTRCGSGLAAPVILLILAAWINDKAGILGRELATAMEWLAGGIALGTIGAAAIVGYMYYSRRNPIWTASGWDKQPMVHEVKAAPEWYERSNGQYAEYAEYEEVS